MQPQADNLVPIGMGAGDPDVVARLAGFPDVQAPDAPGPAIGSMDQLLDVPVTVTAELGRLSLMIGNLLKLGVGSVLELDRLVSEPVDLLVQGTPLARGEVVVIEDRFAIRIKEVLHPKARKAK